MVIRLMLRARIAKNWVRASCGLFARRKIYGTSNLPVESLEDLNSHIPRESLYETRDRLNELSVPASEFKAWLKAYFLEDVTQMITVCERLTVCPHAMLLRTQAKSCSPEHLESVHFAITKVLSSGTTTTEQNISLLTSQLFRSALYGASQNLDDAVRMVLETAFGWSRQSLVRIGNFLEKVCDRRYRHRRSQRIGDKEAQKAYRSIKRAYRLLGSRKSEEVARTHHFEKSTADIFASESPITVHQWVFIITQCRKDRWKTADDILDIWDTIRTVLNETERIAPAAAVMQALNSRHNFELSLRLWEDFKDKAKRAHINGLSWMLPAALQSLCRVSGPDAALQELETVALKCSSIESSSRLLAMQRPDLRHLYSETPKGVVQIDIRTINLFMESLLRTGTGTSHILSLWHSLGAYRVYPNDLTLGLVVNAARLATHLHQGSFSFRQGVYGDGYWNGARVWKTVEQIFRSVVLDTRPKMKELLSRSPGRSIFPTLQSTSWPTFGSPGNDVDFHDHDGEAPLQTFPWRVVSRADLRKRHAHLKPSDRVFAQYLELLGSLGLMERVPLVAAWMRALEIKPSRWTLTVILALCEEIPLHHKAGLNIPSTATWTEGWGPGGDRRTEEELIKFRHWIADWLQCDFEKLPQASDLAEYRRKAQKYWYMPVEDMLSDLQQGDETATFADEMSE